MASIKDLQDQMNKNSQAWHGANKAEQDRLHKENERLQSQIDSMTGGSSTFNPGTGKWSTTGGSSASRPSGVGGSRPSGGSSSRPSGGNWSTGSNGYGSSYGTDASGQNDYSVLIRDAMNAGASADEVQRLLDQRVNKAQQSGYNQYMYDDLYHAAQNYIKQQTQLPQVEDYSDYLADAFAAQKRAALAQINNAYQQNVNAINRAGEGVDTRYQNARNQAAGASELAARNFNEYAAAAGLNSGAGGQAELARNVALQNNLNDLSTAEAQTYADLEQQMANAEVEYNNAIAEAEANGDAALASALYQEKVRVQQANMEALMQQYQMDLQKQQLQYQQKQDAASSALAERQQMAQYGNTFLEMGLMPSQEMLDAMGITAADAQAYINGVCANRALHPPLRTTLFASCQNLLRSMGVSHLQFVVPYGRSVKRKSTQSSGNPAMRSMQSPYISLHSSSTPASVRRLAASWSPSRARVLSSIVRFLLYQRPLRNAILACGDLLFDGRLFRALHAAIGFFDKPKCFPILISLMPFWYSCIHVASSNTAFGLPFGFGGVR